MYFTDAMESISSPMEYEYRNSKKIFELKYGTTQSDETLEIGPHFCIILCLLEIFHYL